jgi:hypothetical protein
MPITTVAYSESQDSATLVNIAALADQHITVSGDDIRIPTGFDRLAGWHFFGPSFTLGQIETPSLRRTGLIDVEPADLAAEPSSPSAFHDRFGDPLQLRVNEVMRALMAEDAVGASRVTAMIWLSGGPVEPVRGEIFTLRVTNATTLVANAWSNGALTFVQTLPEGNYQLVGARMQAAGLQAFRCVFTLGAQGHRPGAIGYDADGDLENARFRYGNAGVWGTFTDNAPPTVDFLSNSADTAQVGHLDVIHQG